MALPTLMECAAWSASLAPALLSAAAGGAVIQALAGTAALAMRRASAAARHEVWLLGFVGALLLPVLSAALPGWHILPASGAARPTSHASETVVALPVFPATLSPKSVAASPPAMPPATSMHGEKALARPATELADAGPTRAAPAMAAAPVRAEPAVLPAPAPAGQTGRAPWSALPWTAWLLPCWFLGSLLVLGRVALGHLSLWSLRRRCVRVTGGDRFDLLERLRRQAGVHRPVELLSSPARVMPMTWGLLRARLLVPGQASDWSAGQSRDVLLHELGHVKRWDCLTQFLAQVACTLYWFNPLAWVAARRMQIERERACDDLVLNGGAEASSYARHLLQSVSSVPSTRLVGAAVAMARVSTLEERMRAILDGRLNRRALTRRGSLAVILLLLSAGLPVAVLKAQQPPAPGAPEATTPARPAPPSAAPGEGRDASPAPSTTPPAGGAPSDPPTPSAPRPSRGMGPAASAGHGEGPTCTFDATLYDLRLPADQIGRLDVDALAAAAETAEAFEKALAALGTAKPVYRANQSVRLSGDTIAISSQVPLITNTRVNDQGQAINTIQYQSVGATFNLAGRAGAAKSIDLDLSIHVSSSADTGTVISDKVKAPAFRSDSLSHKGPVEARKPFVVVSVDAASADNEGKAIAYVGRFKLGAPQSSGSK